jgi:K+ transporter
VLLSLIVEDVARVPDMDRIEIEQFGDGFYRVVAKFGFVEDTEVPHVLELCKEQGLEFDMMDTTFFLGRETLLPSKKPGMAMWREHLFSWMWKNASRAMDFLRLPPNLRHVRRTLLKTSALIPTFGEHDSKHLRSYPPAGIASSKREMSNLPIRNQ